jgi:glycosyltransferase involved in cell wall biosynthesis
MRALFIQPYGLGSHGGGARILRSLVRGQPFEVRSLNCDPNPGQPLDWLDERHLPLRPSLGRLDRTRFAPLGYAVEIPARPFFERRLGREMDAFSPDVVHLLAHWSTDFDAAARLARARRRRVVLSVHDDLAYTLPDRHPLKKRALAALARIWPEADHAFAISRELGEAYNARYGSRPFEIITDGLESIAGQPAPIVPGRLTVYFMGLFHYTYRDNLRALTAALAELKKQRPELALRLVMRCGGFEKNIDAAFPAEVLPYADQAAVERDLGAADLLYLPLPFGREHEPFTRYSLSTKMVTYLGSGVPILYHGPGESAAAGLLARHGAAFLCTAPGVSAIGEALRAALQAPDRDEIVRRALTLARDAFPLERLRSRFLRGLFP